MPARPIAPRSNAAASSSCCGNSASGPAPEFSYPRPMDILAQTQGLIQRFQHGSKFRQYLPDRLRLGHPALGVLGALSRATPPRTLLKLAGPGSFLGLVRPL